MSRGACQNLYSIAIWQKNLPSARQVVHPQNCTGTELFSQYRAQERKTRCSLIRKLQNKESASVMEAFRVIRDEWLADCFDKVFRTITNDNGSEFARLAELEEGSSLRVYYARPYCSSDKGTNENHNGLFRRFIPKGKSIHDHSVEQIERVQQWANTLPRRILGYRTPEECFSEELSVCLTS